MPISDGEREILDELNADEARAEMEDWRTFVDLADDLPGQLEDFCGWLAEYGATPEINTKAMKALELLRPVFEAADCLIYGPDRYDES